MKIDSVLIYGMGLMGGSLALSIQNQFPDTKISAVVRSSKSKMEIKNRNLANEVFLSDEFLNSRSWFEYDLVIFATPVHTILETIKTIPVSGEGNTIFIDLGSTKQTIVANVKVHFSDFSHNYVSTHPMCGSEHVGPESAIADLYKNKLCILTRIPGVRQSAFEFVEFFWSKIGAWTTEMDADKHDETLAYVSHLPHILSSLLVFVAGSNEVTISEVKKNPRPITGGGFRDMSRIAGSNPEMWISIFQENQNYIYQSLDRITEELAVLKQVFNPNSKLDENFIRSLWESAAAKKEIIQKNK
ncbi:prephenate dehydrogenase/arogenate dehydrogenase family protein [Leptospira sp. 96542]|nr:prephenate dehydrogenase/arogenate dehydrogenase family protein [Leptospira sp. 96542]